MPKIPEEDQKLLEERSLEIPGEDRERFIQVVEGELNGLHSGNISRYGLQQSELIHWQKHRFH